MILQSIILGIVEGLTEFLPISSTGHLILVNQYIKFTGSFANVFDVVIQVGAILAVVVLYWTKLFPRLGDQGQSHEVYSLWGKVVVAFIPAGVSGFFLVDLVDHYLFKPIPVAAALIVGAVLLLWAERGQYMVKVDSTASLSYRDAFLIGVAQCMALWPGMSRSASTIIGGLLLGLSRETAAEFSFFLALPTLIGASVYKLAEAGLSYSSYQWMILGIGTLVSFVVAMFVIAVFMNYLKTRKLAPFAYYRIVLGALILVMMLK